MKLGDKVRYRLYVIDHQATLEVSPQDSEEILLYGVYQPYDIDKVDVDMTLTGIARVMEMHVLTMDEEEIHPRQCSEHERVIGLTLETVSQKMTLYDYYEITALATNVVVKHHTYKYDEVTHYSYGECNYTRTYNREYL